LATELALTLREKECGYSKDRDLMLNAVVSQSRLTHNQPESDVGCRCYAEVVAAALHGAGKDDLRKIADNYTQFAPNTFDGKSGGHIEETLRTVSPMSEPPCLA
jgi:ADP-ribosylglycohydrolase